MIDREHGVVREGLVAGFIGATSVALWFLALDLFAGRPFFTPTLLGNALISVLGPVDVPDSVAVVTLVYTLVHYAVFFAIGLLATWLVHRSETVPSVLIGFLILFLAFQVGFLGITTMLAQASMFGQLAWYQIGVANLIAFALMGTYIYRQHPSVGRRLAVALSGRGE